MGCGVAPLKKPILRMRNKCEDSSGNSYAAVVNVIDPAPGNQEHMTCIHEHPMVFHRTNKTKSTILRVQASLNPF